MERTTLLQSRGSGGYVVRRQIAALDEKRCFAWEAAVFVGPWRPGIVTARRSFPLPSGAMLFQPGSVQRVGQPAQIGHLGGAGQIGLLAEAVDPDRRDSELRSGGDVVVEAGGNVDMRTSV
jgi:hypothetical protein